MLSDKNTHQVRNGDNNDKGNVQSVLSKQFTPTSVKLWREAAAHEVITRAEKRNAGSERNESMEKVGREECTGCRG